MANAKPKPKAENKASFSVRFDALERAALAAAAKAEDRAEAYLVRQFVREGLKKAGFLK